MPRVVEWTIGDLAAPPPLPADTQPAVPDASAAGPTLAEALREQLGLTLVSGRGPVETLIIDHIERPTEN